MSRPAEMRIERGSRRSLRPEPIRDLPADDARRDDDGREDEEDGAGAVHSELARVERRERAETREAEDGHGKHEPGPDRRGMDEPRATASLPGDSGRRGLGEREPDRGGDEAEAGCEEPDGVEAIVVEHELAEERAEREPAPETEAVEAQRLAATLLGREVGDHRRRADEEHRLADAGEQAKRDEEPRASPRASRRRRWPPRRARRRRSGRDDPCGPRCVRRPVGTGGASGSRPRW